LSQGRAEIAVSPFTLPDNLNEDLCQIEFIAVARLQHPLTQPRRQLALKELKQCRQIVLRDSAQYQKQDVGWLGSEQHWTVSHVATSIELLRKNLGFAWLPKHTV
jgi:DNA-binding transcriptional LysR family regulator